MLRLPGPAWATPPVALALSRLPPLAVAAQPELASAALSQPPVAVAVPAGAGSGGVEQAVDTTTICSQSNDNYV